MHGVEKGVNEGRNLTRPAAGGGEVALYDPTKAKREIKQAEYAAKLAADLGHWEVVEAAIDAKIDAWADFIGWWRANVSVRHGMNRHTVDISDRKSLTAEDAEDATGITRVQVSRNAKRLEKRDEWRAASVAAARRKVMDGSAVGEIDNHRAQGTGENEWYTPAEYVERSRSVLGTIDLDPASSAIAQKIVRAGKYFTKDDDGLTKEWRGRVWLNPPYAQPAIQHFAEKIVQEVTAGRVVEAIMLTHNYTDTAWFHLASSAASALCFTRGRIGFVSPEGERAAPTQGQTFFYYGNRKQAFAQTFATTGLVVVPA